MPDTRYASLNSAGTAACVAAKLFLPPDDEKALFDELSQLPNGPVKQALHRLATGQWPKKRVVLDVDDVMWPLNEHVAWLASIDFDDIVTFFAKENYMLDEKGKQRLYEAYTTPWLHTRMDFYPDAKLFTALAHDSRIDPWIASNNTSLSAKTDKLLNLRRLFGDDLDRFTLHLPVIDMADSHEKTFPENIFCLIDDSPKNAVKSQAEHVLMRRKPWNQSAWGAQVLKPIRGRVQFYDDNVQCMSMLYQLLEQG